MVVAHHLSVSNEPYTYGEKTAFRDIIQEMKTRWGELVPNGASTIAILDS